MRVEAIPHTLYERKYEGATRGAFDDQVSLNLINESDIFLRRGEYNPSSWDLSIENPGDVLPSSNRRVLLIDKIRNGRPHEGGATMNYEFCASKSSEALAVMGITLNVHPPDVSVEFLRGDLETRGCRVGLYRAKDDHFLIVIRTLPFPGQKGDSSAPSNQRLWNPPCAVGWRGTAWAFWPDAFHKDNPLYCSGYKDGKWTDRIWVTGTQGKTTPGAVVFNDKVYLFHKSNADDSLFYNVLIDPDGRWEGDKLVNGVQLVKAPSAAVLDGKIHIVHLSGTNDKSLRHLIFDGKNWSEDALIPNVQSMDSPSLVAFKGRLHCFYRGQVPDSSMWMVSFDGKGWGNSRMAPGWEMSFSPSAVVARNQIFIFYAHRWGMLACKRYDENGFANWDGDLWQVSALGAPAAAALGDQLFCHHIGGIPVGEIAEMTGVQNQLFCVPLGEAPAPLGGSDGKKFVG